MFSKYSIVTTSWDDGDPLDLRVAEMLSDRGLPGTFYVPIKYRSRARLTDQHLRQLAEQRFEIGAHSVSHRDLRTLNHQELAFELTASKDILEQTLGRAVRTLCYPCGHYDERVIEQARLAGYAGARTTQMLRWSAQFPNFEMPVTVQAFAHTRRSYCKNLLRHGTAADLASYLRRFTSASWVEIAKTSFEAVVKQGGVWHLYGHSWEIERHAQWHEVQEVLDYVAHRPGVLYLTNHQVLKQVSNPLLSAAA